MGVLDFLKGKKEDEEIDRIVNKLKHKDEIIKIVNKAISLRNLNRHVEAIALLKQVIHEYPPALSILGNTYLRIGEVDKAENIFKEMIERSLPLEYRHLIIEACCNMGSLYYGHKKDKLKAIQYYEKALTLIDPKSVADIKTYNVLISGAYMGLCNIYALENDIDKAKKNALLCIKLNPDVILANRIYGIIIANNLLTMPQIEIFKKPDLIIDLKQAKESLENVLSADETDIDALYAMCVVAHTIHILNVMGCIPRNNDIERELDKYSKMLEDFSHKSDDAKEKFEYYDKYNVSLGIICMQLKGYKVTMKE